MTGDAPRSAGEEPEHPAVDEPGPPGVSLRPIVLVLLAIAVLVGLDVAADLTDGVPLEHVALEGLTVLLASVGLVRVLARMREERSQLSGEVGRLRAESVSWRTNAARWQREAEAATRGFVAAVEAEFSRWGLSDAEREVALLLLKGVSLKEIAEARGTAERTVRQQAAAVYAKAGVSGRSELASYFLDALPSSSSSSRASS